jgi:hypothetical protein
MPIEHYDYTDPNGGLHIANVSVEDDADTRRMPPCPACQFELAYGVVNNVHYTEKLLRYKELHEDTNEVEYKQTILRTPDTPEVFGWKCPECGWVEPHCAQCGRGLGLDVANPVLLCDVCAKEASKQE